MVGNSKNHKEFNKSHLVISLLLIDFYRCCYFYRNKKLVIKSDKLSNAYFEQNIIFIKLRWKTEILIFSQNLKLIHKMDLKLKPRMKEVSAPIKSSL